METFRWDLKRKPRDGWQGMEGTIEQRNKASHETGAVMIQTVSKNSCPYLAQTAKFFLYKNIPAAVLGCSNCPQFWLKLKLGLQMVSPGRGTRFDLSRMVGCIPRICHSPIIVSGKFNCNIVNIHGQIYRQAICQHIGCTSAEPFQCQPMQPGRSVK